MTSNQNHLSSDSVISELQCLDFSYGQAPCGPTSCDMTSCNSTSYGQAPCDPTTRDVICNSTSCGQPSCDLTSCDPTSCYLTPRISVSWGPASSDSIAWTEDPAQPMTSQLEDNFDMMRTFSSLPQEESSILRRKGAVRIRSSTTRRKESFLTNLLSPPLSRHTRTGSYDMLDSRSKDMDPGAPSSLRGDESSDFLSSNEDIYRTDSSQRRYVKPVGRRSAAAVLYKIETKERCKESRRFSSPMIRADDYITLIFDSAEDDLEIIVTKDGVTLKDAVLSAFSNRGLCLSKFALVLEGSVTPLPENSCVQHLKGTVIYVKEREELPNRYSESRQSHTRTEKRYSTGGPIILRGRHKREDKLDRLNDHLSNYSTVSIPQIPVHAIDRFPQGFLDSNLLQLEESWESVVRGSEEISRTQVQQQEAIWELLQTEVTYIRQLTLLIDVYAAVLVDLRRISACLLGDINEDNVFGNIGEVYRSNCLLWRDWLSLPLIASRATGQPMNPSLMKQGFLQIQDLLGPYAKFCLCYNRILCFVQSQERESQLFAFYLQWANNRNSLNREGLIGILCQPFQRIMKYGLILSMIKKYTTDPQQCADLDEMIQAVHTYVERIDCEMEEKSRREKLTSVTSRIEGYECLELPPGEDYDRLLEAGYVTLNLDQPMSHRPGVRDLRHQGSLKFRDGQGKWTETFCLLFTDMLLICKGSKKNSDKLKVYKPPIRIDKLVVKRHTDSIFIGIVLSDFQCAAAFYTFNGDAKRVDEWLDKCRETRNNYINDSCLTPLPAIPDHMMEPTSVTGDRTLPASPKSQGPNNPRSSSGSHRNKVRTRSVPNSPIVTDRRAHRPSINSSISLTSNEFVNFGINQSYSSPEPLHQSEKPKLGTDSEPCSTVREEEEEETPVLRPENDIPGQHRHLHRNARCPRRYQTVDTIRENKRESELFKRFSLNIPSHVSGGSYGSAQPSGELRSTSVNRSCASVDSTISSSGISSSPSHLHSGSELSEAGTVPPPCSMIENVSYKPDDDLKSASAPIIQKETPSVKDDDNATWISPPVSATCKSNNGLFRSLTDVSRKNRLTRHMRSKSQSHVCP